MNKSYSIGQAAKRSGHSIDTLRYYERIGILTATPKNASGHRRYSEAGLLALEFVSRLRRTRMPVRVMKQYFDLARNGDRTLGERKRLLIEHAARMETEIRALQDTLAIIRHKLEHYDELTRSNKRRQRATKLVTRRQAAPAIVGANPS